MTVQSPAFCSVYGPVSSWRYGRSLGIDPIGQISTCSFNCVYCQLGDIQQVTRDRQTFIPTEQIARDLQAFAPWDIDVVTLSGSGEPTLALNLAEILTAIKEITAKPAAVLTNSTLLQDAEVRRALGKADIVAAKLDAVDDGGLCRVNRAIAGLDWETIWTGIVQFRREWPGQLAIQTMLLSLWSAEDRDRYANLMQQLQPDEIQVNTPTRPRPLTRQLDRRGNSEPTSSDPVQLLKPVSRDILLAWAREIEGATKIPVRCVPL